MLIGIDIDGVLFPFTEAADEAVATKFGTSPVGPWYTWDWFKDHVTAEQWRWLWGDEGTDAVLSQTWRVYPGVVDTVNTLLEWGHRVHFVTHRDPRRTAVHTATFLALHFGRHPWGGVHVIRNDVAKRRLASWDVFVDDKPDTVWDFRAHTNTRVFAPARPWNSELEDDERLTRYAHPEEIVRWVGRFR